MSTTFSAALTDKERLVRIGKYALRRFLMPVFGFGLFIYFLPKTALLYAICGAYDVSRNSGLGATTLRRYFIGNGFFTWVVSPFNCLLDLLSLPYVNKGVYRLEDLPPAYRDEVTRLIQAATESNLVAQMEEASKQHPRTMAFFRWYGVDQNTFLDAPALRQPWQYIETIGISVFNKKVSTSKHFGYLRASLRILYNLNDMTDDSAYIVVGDRDQLLAREQALHLRRHAVASVFQRDRPDALLPVRRHDPADAVSGRHARRRRRRPPADPEFQVRLLPELEGHRAAVT